MARGQVERIAQAFREEQDAALMYAAMAARERDPTWKTFFERIAQAEGTHAAHWADQLTRAGAPAPSSGLSGRSRLVLWIANRLGTRAAAPFLVALERRDIARYRSHLVDPSLRRQEQQHARVLSAIGSGEREAAAIERWRQPATFNLRAAIFGVNDGLVSNLSLTVGMAGAQVQTGIILLAGIAGLLAGAFSMAGGEYISVRSQREIAQRELDLARAELERAPEETAQALAQLYRARGLPEADADGLAVALAADREAAFESLALEELGLNPRDLGSPIGAGGSSFFAFAAGALVPVLPYLLAPAAAAVPLSVAASGLALFGIGVLLGLLSARHPAVTGLRMLAVAGTAAAATHLVGRFLGVGVTG